MNYNDIISSIVNDFNRSFNLSSEIIYDSRENIINKNWKKSRWFFGYCF